MRLLTTLLLLITWLGGCAPAANREGLTKEVLKADPEFSSVLKKHRELANSIETFERELSLKRSTVEQTIKHMRKDLAATTATVRGKTDDLRKRIEPERQRLELALSMAGEELKAKQAQRASLGRSIAQLKKAVKTASAAWTEEERSRQEAQAQEMLRDAARLDQELAAMREHIRLLKIKLLLIKL